MNRSFAETTSSNFTVIIFFSFTIFPVSSCPQKMPNLIARPWFHNLNSDIAYFDIHRTAYLFFFNLS